MSLSVLDLFSAAAGGWSLGLHRAGFHTVAACEVVDWRRALYAQNFPDVRLYDDVRTLTADRLRADLGALPDIVVGSPPCQDISSANTKGKGVDGERSGLFFEAIRIVGECRPRWVALENSANLRTKGADRVLAALEGHGYTAFPAVVRAGHGRGGAGVGANHERPRAWILAFDADQVVEGALSGLLGWQDAEPSGGPSADPDGFRWDEGRSGRRVGIDLSLPGDPEHPEGLGYESWRAWRYRPDGLGSSPTDAGGAPPADAHQARQAHGCLEPGLRQAEIAGAGCRDERRDDGDAPEDGRGSGRARRRALATAGLSIATCGDAAGSHPHDEGQSDGAEHDEVGGGAGAGGDASRPWSQWNGGLAHHLRVDDGLSAWVAQSRVDIGGPRGTAAAGLLVEAFGDAVVPQIPEAIGRAILRTEAALATLYRRAAA